MINNIAKARNQFRKEARRLVRKIVKFNNMEIDKVLKKIGFKRTCYRFGPIYTNGDLIIKMHSWDINASCTPRVICGPKPKSKFTVPEVIFDLDGATWTIQPKVSYKNRGAAFRYLYAHVKNWSDPALRNCGWWARKPLIYDW